MLHVRGVTGAGGGPEKTILNSPRFLQTLGYESVCAYMHPPRDPGWESIQSRAVEANAEVVSIIDRGPWDWRVLKELIRYCRQHRVAIWHGHDYKSNALGLIVRRFWPMKLVTTVHGWVQHTRRTPLYYKIDQLSLRRYDEVICVSQDLYDTCRGLGVPASRCHLIHNGIDAETFRRSQPVNRAREVALASRLALSSSARWAGSLPKKGFDLLIRAAARLQDAGHDVHVWIAGEGAARGRP